MTNRKKGTPGKRQPTRKYAVRSRSRRNFHHGKGIPDYKTDMVNVDWLCEYHKDVQAYRRSAAKMKGDPRPEVMKEPLLPLARPEFPWDDTRGFEERYMRDQICSRMEKCKQAGLPIPRNLDGEILADSINDVYLFSDAIEEVLNAGKDERKPISEILVGATHASMLHDILAYRIVENSRHRFELQSDCSPIDRLGFPDIIGTEELEREIGDDGSVIPNPLRDIEVKFSTIRMRSNRPGQIQEPSHTITARPGYYLFVHHGEQDTPDLVTSQSPNNERDQSKNHEDRTGRMWVNSVDLYYLPESVYEHEKLYSINKKTGKKVNKTVNIDDYAIPVELYSDVPHDLEFNKRVGLTSAARTLIKRLAEFIDKPSRVMEESDRITRTVTAKISELGDETASSIKNAILRLKELEIIKKCGSLENADKTMEIEIEFDESLINGYESTHYAQRLEALLEIQRNSRGLKRPSAVEIKDLSIDERVNGLTALAKFTLLEILSHMISQNPMMPLQTVLSQMTVATKQLFGRKGTLTELINTQLVALDAETCSIQISEQTDIMTLRNMLLQGVMPQQDPNFDIAAATYRLWAINIVAILTAMKNVSLDSFIPYLQLRQLGIAWIRTLPTHVMDDQNSDPTLGFYNSVNCLVSENRRVLKRHILGSTMEFHLITWHSPQAYEHADRLIEIIKNQRPEINPPRSIEQLQENLLSVRLGAGRITCMILDAFLNQKKGETITSRTFISKKTEIHKSSVAKVIKRLRDAQILVVEDTTRRPFPLRIDPVVKGDRNMVAYLREVAGQWETHAQECEVATANVLVEFGNASIEERLQRADMLLTGVRKPSRQYLKPILAILSKQKNKFIEQREIARRIRVMAANEGVNIRYTAVSSAVSYAMCALDEVAVTFRQDQNGMPFLVAPKGKGIGKSRSGRTSFARLADNIRLNPSRCIELQRVLNARNADVTTSIIVGHPQDNQHFCPKKATSSLRHQRHVLLLQILEEHLPLDGHMRSREIHELMKRTCSQRNLDPKPYLKNLTASILALNKEQNSILNIVQDSRGGYMLTWDSPQAFAAIPEMIKLMIAKRQST